MKNTFRKTIIFQMILALLAAGLVFCGTAAAGFVSASSDRVKTMGRWIPADNGSLYAGRGAVIASVEFEGTGVQVQMFSDSVKDVWWLKKLDDGPMERIKARMGINDLYQDLPFGKHTLTIIRETEGMGGVTILRGFIFIGEKEEPAVNTSTSVKVDTVKDRSSGKQEPGNPISDKKLSAGRSSDRRNAEKQPVKKPHSKKILSDKTVAENVSSGEPLSKTGSGSGNGASADPDDASVPSVPRRRSIEIIGDSVAAGAFIYPDGDYFQRESGYLAFGPRLARMLDADWSCVASSGEGAVRNNDEKAPYNAKHADEQIERAFYTQKEPRWNNQMDDPDLVILAYGENDFNDAVNRPSDEYFKMQYKKLILKLRQFRPNSVIFCMTPANTETSRQSVPGMGGAVEELRAEGDGRVYFIDLNANGPLLDRSDFLDGVHPLSSGHEKIALYLRERVCAILGWN